MAADKLQYEFKVDGTLGVLLKAADTLDTIEGKLAKILSKKIDFGNTLKIAQPLEAFNNSVQHASTMMSGAVMKTAELSDKMAIAQKNTGLTDAEMQGLKKTIDSMQTRTSTADLFGIASSAGKLGVPKAEIADFIKVIDKASVALGDEFGGNTEAVAMLLGKIRGQYKEFAGMPIAQSLEGIGSAINYLGKQGANSAPNVGEFIQRVSSLNLGLANAAGMGATLQELGLSAEIASGGLQNILTLAKTESAKFAQHLRMPVKAFEDLVNKNPNQAIIKLMESFKGASQTQIAQALDKLKVGSQESQRVVGLLADNVEMLRIREVQAAYQLQKKTDLDKEAAIMNNTLAGQIAKTQKEFDKYIVGLGAGLAPYMNIIQTTAFMSTGLAALIPLVSLMSQVLTGGFQWLLRYGLGLMVVDGQLKFTKTSFIGVMIQMGRFIVMTAVQGVQAILLFAGRLVFLSAMALPALMVALFSTSSAVTLLNAAMLMNPIGLIIAGVALLVSWFIIMWRSTGSVSGALLGMWNQILAYNPFSLLAQAIDYLLGTNIFGALQSWFKTITGWLDGIWKKAKEFFNWVTGSSETLAKAEQGAKVIKKREAAEKIDPAYGAEKGLADMLRKEKITPEQFKMMQQSPKIPTTYSSGLGDLGGNKDTKKNIEGVSGGGSKPTTINISIGKLNEKIEVSTVNLREGVDDIERIMIQLLMRVVNNANQYASN
jgi:TP901 family phage tail tape measure protein